MQSASHVVRLVGCDDAVPFKHFNVHADAVDYGRSCLDYGGAEQALIYAVADTSDARAAIAAVQAGKATHVQTCVRHATEAEVETAKEQAREAARKVGPRAFLKYLGILAKDASPDPPKIRRRMVTK
jgi:hypothetical protein